MTMLTLPAGETQGSYVDIAIVPERGEETAVGGENVVASGGCELGEGLGVVPDGSCGADLPTPPRYEGLNQSAGELPVAEGVPEAGRPCHAGHEWIVFSTALRDCSLMLQCVECGAMGSVVDPSEEEWSEAFHAPSRPYRWQDGDEGHREGLRGTLCDQGHRRSPLQCPSQQSLPETRGYDRVPDGIWEHPGGLSDTEREEVLDLAGFVEGSDLCSRLLPDFIRGCEEDTGVRHSEATHTIVGRVERWDAKGIHCSPPVVARIIREFATWEPVHGQVPERV